MIEQLASYQSEGARTALFALFGCCRRRVVRALELLEISGRRRTAIGRVGVTDAVDLAALLSPWDVVCRRYRSELYDPQIDMFVPNGEQQPFRAWDSFVHHKFIPSVVREDETVRNVLRAVGAMPCRSGDDAVMALVHRFSEMALPDTPPIWAPEEELET